MSLFRVDNYTYYVTEDLVALVEALEEALENAFGGLIDRAHISSYKPEWGRVQDLLVFKDYGTKKVHMNRQEWVTDPKTGKDRFETRQVRVYVKEDKSWRRDGKNEVRIIPPNRLYINPLEALADCDKGEDSDSCYLPEEAVFQIAARVAVLYGDPTAPRWSSSDKTVRGLAALRTAGLPRVRVGTKRVPLKLAERQRVARKDAQRVWREAGSNQTQMRKTMGRIAADNLYALKRLNKCSVSLTGAEEELSRLIQLMESSSLRMGELLDEMMASVDDNTSEEGE